MTPSEAAVPAAATTRPAIAGPVANATEKQTFSSLLPSASVPLGSSAAATAARVRARPTIATAPSASASTIRTGSGAPPDSAAIAAKSAASQR